MGASLVAYVLDALQLALWLSLPAVLAAWAAGLLATGVGHFTRLGDATTSSVPRQIAVALALWVSMAWAGRELVGLTLRLWTTLGGVGGA